MSPIQPVKQLIAVEISPDPSKGHQPILQLLTLGLSLGFGSDGQSIDRVASVDQERAASPVGIFDQERELAPGCGSDGPGCFVHVDHLSNVLSHQQSRGASVRASDQATRGC